MLNGTIFEIRKYKKKRKKKRFGILKSGSGGPPSGQLSFGKPLILPASTSYLLCLQFLLSLPLLFIFVSFAPSLSVSFSLNKILITQSSLTEISSFQLFLHDPISIISSREPFLLKFYCKPWKRNPYYTRIPFFTFIFHLHFWGIFNFAELQILECNG